MAVQRSRARIRTSEWQSSKSPAVAVFTRSKSNKWHKVCVECAMKAAQIQSHPETNHLCLKYEFPITVLTWIMASYLETSHAQVSGGWPFGFYDLISPSPCLWIAQPLADLSAPFGPSVYLQVGKVCRTVLRLISKRPLKRVTNELRLTCLGERPPSLSEHIFKSDIILTEQSLAYIA